MKKERVNLKFWGSEEAVELFKRFLDENLLATISPTKPSSQGGCHAFATVEIIE